MKLTGAFSILIIAIAPSIVMAQQASDYFPLTQGSTWVFEHIQEVGGVVKPAAIMATTTIDTVTMRVNGTVSDFGKIYAILEMDGDVWGRYRVEGHYIYRLYTSAGSSDTREQTRFDLTPSDNDPYRMNTSGGFYSPRTVHTMMLPVGEVEGYECVIGYGPDSNHYGERYFLVESVGLAYFRLFDGWRIPSVTDTYRLISYDVQPVAVNKHMPDEAFDLMPPYPNPFNPATTLSFDLARLCDVTLAVYNTTGQRVAVLVDGTVDAGTHKAVFDGRELPSGLYIARLETGQTVRSVKMLLMK